MQLDTMIEFVTWVEAAPANIFRRSQNNNAQHNFVRIIELNAATNIEVERNLELSNNPTIEVARFRQVIAAIHDEVTGAYA